MPTIVDRLNIIATFGANTGDVVGDVRFQRMKHMLLTQAWEPTNTDLADSDSLQAALALAMNLPKSDPNKVYLITGFHEADDNTGDPNLGTLADGYEEVLNEAIPKYAFRHTAGIAQTQSYVAFNGFAGNIYFIDSASNFFYKGKPNGGGKGFDLANYYASYPRPGGSSAINVGSIRITLADPEEFKTNVGAVHVTFAIKTLANLQDVQLKELAAATGYAFKVGAATLYAGQNIYDTYKDLLAVIGAWEFVNRTDNTIVAAASVAKDDTVKGWTVTASSTPTINAGTILTLRLKAPAVLSALTAPVLGIEGNPLKVVKP